MKHQRIAIVVLLILAVLAAEWIWLQLRDQPSPDSPVAAVPGHVAVPGGPFALTDHRGQAMSDRDFRGGLVLIVFGYTYCPDVCPTTLQRVANALDLLGEEAEGVQPLFVTIDPERDTPEVLAGYVAAFHPRLVGLTGTREQIERMARNYRVYHARVDMEEGDYLMDHSAFIYLTGPDGRPLTYFPHDLPPEDMAARLREFLDGTV